MEANIVTASNLLLHLIMMLGTALKMQQNHDAILPKLENLTVVESSKAIFRPTTSALALTDSVDLDFVGKDEKGNPCTREGFS